MLLHLLPYLIGVAPLLNLFFDLLTGETINPLKYAIGITLGIGLIVYTVVDRRRTENKSDVEEKQEEIKKPHQK